mgnify:CR=1 FL=1
MNDTMYPLNTLDINGDAIPDIFEQDLNGDGRIDILMIDANHDGAAEVTIQSDTGLVHVEPQFPDMASFIAGVSSPDFVPGSSPVPGYAPAMETPEVHDTITTDTLVPALNTVTYEELPKFPGSLDHGMDFDGRTWEILGGTESLVVVDLSGDGRPDIFGIDFDGDGVTDVAGRYLDTDGDGVADTMGIDFDQDGHFDFFESMM